MPPAARPRPACNGTGRAVFGRGRGGEAAGAAGRVVPLDPDRSLVTAAQVDPARFDALYRKYLAQVYSFAYHELGNHHEAEDVTERTFLLALDALPRFREEAPDEAGPEASTFRVWLLRIARNAIANQRRTVRRHPVMPLDAVGEAAAPDDPERAVLARARRLRRVGGGRPPARRPSARGRPALRGGDEHGRDRGRPRPLRGRSARPPPPGAAHGGPRSGRAGRDAMTATALESVEIEALVDRPLPRRAPGRRGAPHARRPAGPGPGPGPAQRRAPPPRRARARPSLVPLRGAPRATPRGGGRPACASRPRSAARARSCRSPRPCPTTARPTPRRPLLFGGAVTSAALGLAGAAFVAWRRTRGAPTDPMARAVRLARAARAVRDGTATELH